MSACPNCSAARIGAEVASLCTECGAVAISGTTVSAPTIIATIVGLAALTFVVATSLRSAKQAAGALLLVRRPGICSR